MKHLPLVLLCTIFCTLSSAELKSQHCATLLSSDPTVDHVAWQDFEKRWKKQRGQQAISLGITIHIVTGAVDIPLQKLYSELDAINRMFAGSGLNFFFCGAPRVINGQRNLFTYNQASTELNAKYHVANTINIFYLDEIGDSQLSQFACGISTFPFDSSPRQRFIIMQKSCSTNGSTLAHEIGHLFGLLHTHETFGGREFVNGSNCAIAGDQLCDTPADPNLGRGGLQGCLYVGNEKDANGDAYRPDPSNIMSYAPDACSNQFTLDQNARMNFWYEQELSYLMQECDFFPDFALSTFQNDLEISSGQQVEFSFDFESIAVSEESKVEVYFSLFGENDDLPTIIHKDTVTIAADSEQFNRSFNFEFPVTKGTGNYTLTVILDPNSHFLERDKRNNLQEIQVTVDNSQFSDQLIFPNPVNDELTIFLRDKNNKGDIHIEINDLYGRLFLSEKRFKKSEEFFTRINVSDLPIGTYFVSVFIDRDKKPSELFDFEKLGLEPQVWIYSGQWIKLVSTKNRTFLA